MSGRGFAGSLPHTTFSTMPLQCHSEGAPRGHDPLVAAASDAAAEMRLHCPKDHPSSGRRCCREASWNQLLGLNIRLHISGLTYHETARPCHICPHLALLPQRAVTLRSHSPCQKPNSIEYGGARKQLGMSPHEQASGSRAEAGPGEEHAIPQPQRPGNLQRQAGNAQDCGQRERITASAVCLQFGLAAFRPSPLNL